jgi:hydrogenase maturation protease
MSRPEEAARGDGSAVGVTRVIGLGVEDRGDDAAGLLVARLLGAVVPAWVEVHECAGDAGAPEYLLQGARRIVVVDAARGGEPGAVERLPLGAARAARAARVRGTPGPDSLPADARLYVVYGHRFEPGPVTPAVADGVWTAAELILRRELDG